MPTPAASKSNTSLRMANANCLQVSLRGWSSRTNDQLRIVTGPVSMPFMGLLVNDCAYLVQATVMACGRVISPNKIGGRSEEHTSELQSRPHLVCRLLLEKKKKTKKK